MPTVSCGFWSTLPSQALQVSLFILLLWYKRIHSLVIPRHLSNLYDETAKPILFSDIFSKALTTLQVINFDLRQRLSSLAFQISLSDQHPIRHTSLISNTFKP